MSSRRGVVHLLCSLSLLAAASACDSTQANPVEADYVLQSLNESALPYDHEGLGCCTYLSGELELEEGRYTMSLTFRNRNSGLVFTAIEWGRYSQPQPGLLSFSRDSSAVAPLGLDVGTLAGNGIEVTFGGEGPGSPDQFHAFFVLRE